MDLEDYSKNLIESQSKVPERHHINKQIYTQIQQTLAGQNVGSREIIEQVVRATQVYLQEHLDLPPSTNYLDLEKSQQTQILQDVLAGRQLLPRNNLNEVGADTVYSVLINLDRNSESDQKKLRKKQLLMTLLDNQVERSGSVISHLGFFNKLHLRYLTFEMRQFLWKSLLFDSQLFLDYKTNMEGDNSILYKTSRDDTLILHEITRILSENDWTGDLNRILSEKSKNVTLLKQVLIYSQVVLGRTTVLPESMVYLLIPLVFVFRSYDIEFRTQYIASMYINAIKNTYQMIHIPSHPSYEEFHEDFEKQIIAYFETVNELDPDLGNHLTDNILTKEAHQRDPYQLKKYSELLEDVSEGVNRFFYHPMTQDQLNQTFEEPNDALIYNFIKNYISRLSCGFVHIEITCIIMDALLTKKNKQKGDRYLPISLAVVTVLLKDYGMMEARSYYDVQKIIEKKAKTEVYEYEFFKLFKQAIMDKEGNIKDELDDPIEAKIAPSDLGRYFQDLNQIKDELDEEEDRNENLKNIKAKLRADWDAYQIPQGYQSLNTAVNPLLEQLDQYEEQDAQQLEQYKLEQEQAQNAIEERKQEEQQKQNEQQQQPFSQTIGRKKVSIDHLVKQPDPPPVYQRQQDAPIQQQNPTQPKRPQPVNLARDLQKQPTQIKQDQAQIQQQPPPPDNLFKQLQGDKNFNVLIQGIKKGITDPEKTRKQQGPIIGQFKMENPGIVLGVPDYGYIVDDVFYEFLDQVKKSQF